MVIYGDSPREYPYYPTKIRKQKYSIKTRVIDFANKPITFGNKDHVAGGASGSTTTAWAATDVLRAIKVKAGQTVLGIQVEILTRSMDLLDVIGVGYGSDTTKWGVYQLNRPLGVVNGDSINSIKEVRPDNFIEPLYFSSDDTIDIYIYRAAMVGKIRLIVHLMEDDR